MGNSSEIKPLYPDATFENKCLCSGMLATIIIRSFPIYRDIDWLGSVHRTMIPHDLEHDVHSASGGVSSITVLCLALIRNPSLNAKSEPRLRKAEM